MAISNLPDRLQRHFDLKYSLSTSPEVPARPRWPRDRLAAGRLIIPGLLPSAAHVLEIGAGDGSLFRQFDSDRVAFGRYVLSEVSTPRLVVLQSIADRAEVEAVGIDAESVDESLGSFDAVLLVGIIQVLIDPIGTLNALKTVLRPGGFLWIECNNLAKYTRRIKLVAGRLPSTSSRDEGLTTFEGHPTDLYDEGCLHYFTYGSLERLLTERCGFGRVERFPHPSSPRLLGGAIDSWLARRFPTLMADITVAAYID